jgi:hypothetical protein
MEIDVRPVKQHEARSDAGLEIGQRIALWRMLEACRGAEVSTIAC